MEKVILKHLQDYGSITSWDAIIHYNCTRLGHYIWLLRREGYRINGTREPFTNKITGKKSTYVRYALAEN